MAERTIASWLNTLTGKRAGEERQRSAFSPFVVRTLPPRVQFARINVQPPFEGYLSANDIIIFHAETSASDAEVFLQGRFLTPENRLSYFNVSVKPLSDRLAVTLNFTLGEVFLLGMAVTANVTFPPGSTWVKVMLVSGSLTSPSTTVETLIHGYLGGFTNPTWPAYGFQNEGDGRGNIRFIAGTTPAAGVDWSETVPTNALWRLQSIRAVLTTSATAGSRIVRLIVDNNPDIAFIVDAPGSQGVSLVRNYTCSSLGYAQSPVNDAFLLGFPAGLLLREAARIRVATEALRATDAWSAIVMLVEEWLQP